MSCYNIDNLHPEFIHLLEKGKLHEKSAYYLSALDMEYEQQWVLRLYYEHGFIPKIRQSQAIKEAYERKKLTIKFLTSMMEIGKQPQKIVFNFADIQPFFDEGTDPEEMKRDVLKVLSHWKNNRG